MFPLPGLGSMDGCQYILCVVNRRLHYAWVVWVVNQYACFGELQGNVEHLRKATGPLWTPGSQKAGACFFAKRFQSHGVPLAKGLGALVFHALIVKGGGYTRHFLFLWLTLKEGIPEIGSEASQRITNLFKYSPAIVAMWLKRLCGHCFPHEEPERFLYLFLSQSDIKSYHERLWKKKEGVFHINLNFLILFLTHCFTCDYLTPLGNFTSSCCVTAVHEPQWSPRTR